MAMSGVEDYEVPIGRCANLSDKVDCLMKGYLNKEECRSIPLGGPVRKRYWFVLSAKAPYLFWYKSDTSVTPLGKIELASAAFTYDPRNKGNFEIRSCSQCHVLEAFDHNDRLQWLSILQAARRNHLGPKLPIQNQKNEVECSAAISTQTSDSLLIDFGEEKSKDNIPNSSKDDVFVEREPSTSSAVEALKISSNKEDLVKELGSQFYLTTRGTLNDHSFHVPEIVTPMEPISTHATIADNKPPPRPPPPNRVSFAPQNGNRTKSDSMESKPRSPSSVGQSSKQHIVSILGRLPSFNYSNNKSKNCENCNQFIDVINQLKLRNSNLQDELTLKDDVTNSLRKSVLSAKLQIEAMKDYQDLSDSMERTTFILDQVGRLSHVEQSYAESMRRIKELQTRLECAEGEYSKAQTGLESYKEALRSKEEVVMKLMAQQDANHNNTHIDQAPLSDLGFDLCEPAVLIASDSGPKSKLVLPSESEVSDMVELERAKDLINGYQNQNQYLNKEIIDLQTKLQESQVKLDQLQDAYYEKEAECYQKKSKIVLLLNHLQQSSNKEISPEQMCDLLSESLSDRRICEPGTITEQQMNMTDNLGFYIFDNKTRGERSMSEDGEFRPDDLITTAARFQKQSEQIKFKREKVHDTNYEEWLDRWDSFLVNTADRPGLEPSEQLKILVREGVPSSYRVRVWKNLVLYWTQKQQSEVGQGYYETQLRKSFTKSTETYDQSLKQIDIDLTRTLPGNKYFDDPEAGKIESLRHILYAFRAHNPDVGYCQGINRLGAVALLYLEEREAFWFLVACIEHLQPVTYYTQQDKLVTVQADLKVLQDLIGEKLSRLASHFKTLEVDLTMFSVSWFMTIFVDSLSHNMYLSVFDAFLTEGNKVLFRFALAILKLCESELLECDSSLAVHSCLNRLNKIVTDYNKLAHVAFKELNPFPRKHIESRRLFHQNQLRAQLLR